MLKTLSLTADDDQAEAAETADQDNSESRMLRALEALSSQPAAQPGQSRDNNGFRKPQSPQRDAFRGEPAHHANKARHRFVRDGEVQVVRAAVVRSRDTAQPASRPDPEIGRLHQQIDELKLRAEQSERARKESVDQVRTLQTKLAHAELALNDAQLLAQSRAEEIRALQESLATARADVPQPRPAPRPPASAAEPMEHGDRSAQDDAAPIRRGPGRPRKIHPLVTHPTEPEPVEWWLLPNKPKRR